MNYETYITTLAPATADGAVQEVLLHAVADTWAEFGRSAGKRTILAVAGISVIFGGIGTH